MRNLKRLSGYVVSMMLIVTLLAASAPAKEYTVGLTSHYSRAFILVAAEKGFFAEEGVTVTPKKYWSIADWIRAWRHGRIDFSALWISGHIDESSSGSQNNVMLGGFNYSQGTVNVIAAPEVTPENFTQHRVGMTVDVFAHRWMLWPYLQQHQIEMSDVQVVAGMSDQEVADNFLGGRLKVAILIGEAAQSALREGRGVAIASETPELALTSLSMNRAAYDAMPRDDLKGIMRGIIRAIEWMRNPANERELYELLKAQWTEGGAELGVYSSFEAFQQDRQRYVEIAPEDLYETNSVTLRESFAEAEKVLAAMGKPTDFLVYDEAVDTSILLEILEEMGYGPKPEGTE